MKTIERLRTFKPSSGPWAYEPIYWAFRMAEKGGNTHVPDDLPENAKYPSRDDAVYIAEVCNALPALLAVVEAAEVIATTHAPLRNSEVLRTVRVDQVESLTSALRALEGGD